MAHGVSFAGRPLSSLCAPITGFTAVRVRYPSHRRTTKQQDSPHSRTRPNRRQIAHEQPFPICAPITIHESMIAGTTVHSRARSIHDAATL